MLDDMGKAFGALLLAFALSSPVLADDDPVALATRGAALQDAGDWIQAREVYAQLEKIRGQENRAVYFQAFTASQAGDYEEALTLAQRATLLKGPYRQQAKLLYADTLARLGELERAKNFYMGLHATADDDDRVLIERRVAALNKLLKLDASNGLTPATAPSWTTKHKQVDGRAILDEAKAAYAAHDFQRAHKLAQQAATVPGPQKLDAKFLYADTMLEMGDYQRAKNFYIALHRSTSGMHRRDAQRKLAAANAKLGLDARAGLTD